MMPGYGGMGGWAWLFMSGGTVLLLVVVGLGVWLLVRLTGNIQSPAWPQTRSGREILAERYARGEIDEQEYQQRLGTLGG